MNLAKYRNRKGYGIKKQWSANAIRAKARKRMEPAVEEEDGSVDVFTPKPAKFVRVELTLFDGTEKSKTVSARVYRFDETRLILRGKVQAASTIGRRVALKLDRML